MRKKLDRGLRSISERLGDQGEIEGKCNAGKMLS